MSREMEKLLEGYEPKNAEKTVARLRAKWLRSAPVSMASIKASQRAQQETVGIPVPVLKQMGKALARQLGKDSGRGLPLARALWERGGREGRVVAVYLLGALVLRCAPDGMR